MQDKKSGSPYHMLHQVRGLHHCRTHKLLDKLGVYPGQPPLLFALHKQDGQSQKELSEKLSIQPATITMMVRRMTKAGLLERRQDTKDQRISRVYLTEQGKDVRKKVAAAVDEIEKECFKDFTEQEEELLGRLLFKMKQNLIEACEKNA